MGKKIEIMSLMIMQVIALSNSILVCMQVIVLSNSTIV